MNMRIGVFGGSGFTGIELVRLLARHPRVQVTTVTSDKWVGQTVRGLEALKYVGHDDGSEAKLDVALLATPAEVSLQLAPKLIARGSRIIDLSGAFRLKDPAAYPKWYGFEHTEAALLKEAVYGLPEVSRQAGRLVANPGCYATAAALALHPLLKAGAIDPSTIVVSAASGVSGAGRKASEEYSFMEIEGDFRAYRVLKHQHTPEIAQTVGVNDLVFVPHLLPIQRGILCTVVARLSKKDDPGAVIADAYAKEPLIKLLPSADAVRVADVVRTPHCLIGASSDGDRVVVVTAIDNLLKGAASQAVQNLNLMLGAPETEGLS